MSYMSAKVTFQIDAPELMPNEIFEKLQNALNDMMYELEKSTSPGFINYTLGDTISEIK